MQRLLNDASKLSGVKYDLGNLADMYSAIHVIQTEMDITGTTAKEAATTLTGSFAAMKSAAQNVMGSLATGADLSAPLQALAESARTFLVGNLLPMVGDVLAGIPQLVYDLVPQILQSGTELVSSLAAGFAQCVPDFLSTALPQLLSFTQELRANAGEFVNAGLNMITQLVNGLIAGLPDLIAYVPDIVINIAGVINDNMPKILAQGVSLVVQLVVGIGKAVPQLLANWKKILQSVLSVIAAFNWLNIGKSILTGVANGVRSMGAGLLNAFKGGFSSALQWLWELPGKLFQLAKDAIQSFIAGLTGADAATAVTAGLDLAASASGEDTGLAGWASANADLADSAQDMAQTVIPAYTKSGSAAVSAASGVSAAAKTAASAVESYSDTVTQLLGDTTRVTQTVQEVLSDGTKQTRQTVTDTSRQMVGGVLKDIKTITETAADGTTTVKQTMETVRETAKTVTATFDTVTDGIAASTQTVTETLTDGTETTKQVITEKENKVLNGMLVTVERAKTIAADGGVQVAETIKKASADTFSGLTKGWQEETDKGVLGTFDTLVKAVKKQDWLSVGQWVVSTLYNGLAPETKELIDSFGKNLIQQVNSFLGKGISQIADGAWGLGTQIFSGLTGGIGDVVSQFSGLGTTLTGIFQGLQQPLSAVSLAISKGLSGGLLSCFPEILTAVGGLLTSIGAAFTGMLEAIGGTLTALGIPTGPLMIAAGIALVAVIAGLVAALGVSFRRKNTSTGGTASGGSVISNTASSLWDYEKTSPLPQRTQRPNIEVNQYIYSKAQTAADLMREAQYEQERAVLAGV